MIYPVFAISPENRAKLKAELMAYNAPEHLAEQTIDLLAHAVQQASEKIEVIAQSAGTSAVEMMVIMNAPSLLAQHMAIITRGLIGYAEQTQGMVVSPTARADMLKRMTGED